jgi:hypothetical protein
MSAAYLQTSYFEVFLMLVKAAGWVAYGLAACAATICCAIALFEHGATLPDILGRNWRKYPTAAVIALIASSPLMAFFLAWGRWSGA